MTTIKARDARIPTEVFSKVAHAGERVRVTRHKSEAVYIVSEEDFQLLERLEDLVDIQDAAAAIAEIESGKVATVAWDKVKAEARL